MKIKSIHLHTNKLKKEKEFYADILGFEVIEDTKEVFSIRVGWSELSFHRSEQSHVYHYCFLIPSNQLQEALKWMKERVDIIDIKNGREIQQFESWNAESFYFFDGSGNLAECIVRYDLHNNNSTLFNHNSFLCVNEIGMPTTNIRDTNALLEKTLHTSFWKGDYSRFGTNGSQEGLFLLPNLKVKDEWFPTNQKIRTEPFEIIVESNGKTQNMSFSNGKVSFLKKK